MTITNIQNLTLNLSFDARGNDMIWTFFSVLVLFLIYLPMAAIPYYAFGGAAQDNVALSISSGPLKVTVEIMLLLHLVAAFPILLNPPAQYFENLMEIPLGKYILKVIFSYIVILFT